MSASLVGSEMCIRDRRAEGVSQRLGQAAGLGASAGDQHGRCGRVLQALPPVQPLPVGAHDAASAARAAPG
eukprot:10183312-Alexandrium_andersonii.AAC.1